jgi:hypothetical protein
MAQRLELLAEKHRVENAKAELEQTERRLIAEAKRRSVADRISSGDDFVQAAEDVEREFDETTFLSAQERDDLERWRLAIAQQNESLQAVKKALVELNAKQAAKKRFALLAAKRSVENVKAALQRAEARLIEKAQQRRVEDRLFEEGPEDEAAEDEADEDLEGESNERVFLDWKDFVVPGEFQDEATFLWERERDDLESWRLAMGLQDESLEVIKKALADLDAKEGTDWVAEVRKMMEGRKRWRELICDSGGELWMQEIRHEEDRLSAIQREVDQIDEQSQKQAASRIAPRAQPRGNEPATVAPAMPNVQGPKAEPGDWDAERQAEASTAAQAGDTPSRLRRDRRPIASPRTAQRKAIVQQHRKLSAADLCKRFDFESVRVPEGWHGVSKWCDAYKKPELRKRIRTIISKDRK